MKSRHLLHLILKNEKEFWNIRKIFYWPCKIFCRIFRVASVASICRFEIRCVHIHTREKNREKNCSLRFVRLRINKRAKMCFGRVSQRYEECTLTCADLLKNILRMQLLHLSSNPYLSLFFFLFFSPFVLFGGCTCTRKFTSKCLKKKCTQLDCESSDLKYSFLSEEKGDVHGCSKFVDTGILINRAINNKFLS